ncbi:hypothetical protein [Aquimarina algiphila]|uniref:Uncharacterized protein n=1 Tax=Aquimarina algiphila TaxID=2047982 RepID=A0A554VAT4_9FLAO|nr:hypothetical protein [Aquimarina algiphila]TSE03392.1 hypothetical protein FOF46_29435 [Aquimarina algiphila]
MNLGYRKSIDIDVLKRIIDVKLNQTKGLVTISVEVPISDSLRNSFEDQGIKVMENKLHLISNNLFQYKFEWS